jgi:hypothetical protein
MIWRFINSQGIAGLAASLALGVLLLIQKGETHHWRKQSASFEQLYRQEQGAFAGTVERYRAAAEAARLADQANANRVAADQRAINERTQDDFEARLAAARARARELRIQSEAAADSGAGRSAQLPGFSTSARSVAEAAGEDRISSPTREVASRGPLQIEDALTATEQAIQLDELIRWVRAQGKVDNNASAIASPQGD